MASPTWHSADQQTATGTGDTYTVTKPTNIASGDLIVAFVYIRPTENEGPTVTAPAGFSLIVERADSGAYSDVKAYYKVAGGSEPANYSWSDSGEDNYWWGVVCGRITGHDSEDIIDKTSSVFATFPAESIVLPSITPTNDHTLMLAGVCQQTNNAFTEPGDMTRIWLDATDNQKSAMEEDLATTDATGTRTWSWSGGGRAVGVMFNINPPSPNVSVATPTATATAEAIAPTITAIEPNVSIDAPTAEATAEGIAPTVSGQRNANITAPTATATAEAIAPSEITIKVTGVSVYPTEATIAPGEILIVTATVTPTNASNKTINWTSDDHGVATVNNGIVTAVAEGNATITATSAENATIDATLALTVEEYPITVYEKVTIHDRFLAETHELNNNEIVSLTIEKELGGNYGLNLVIPHNAENANQITAGKYIGCEGQHYFLENISTTRGSDGNPLLNVRATHIFFEIEKRQSNIEVRRRGTILDFLQELLMQYGITVSGATGDHTLYNTERYVSYEATDSVMDCLKKIFQPYFATYRVSNLRLIVIPNVGELADRGYSFEYAVNNESITRELDYSDIVTKLYATGKEIELTVDAPGGIKNLYRTERERSMSFSGVSSTDDLGYLANRYLGHKQIPLETYSLSVAELKHIANINSTDGGIFPGRNFNIDLGQRVTVTDANFGISKLSVVQRYSYKPLEPWEFSTVLVGDLKPFDVTFTEPDEDEETLADATVEQFADITVLLGTAIGDIELPTIVKVTMPDGTVKEFDVTWTGHYDGNVVDTYPLEGELDLPDDMENPDDLKAAINIIVVDEDFCIDLRGIISTEDPDDEKGKEDCLWFKY